MIKPECLLFYPHESGTVFKSYVTSSVDSQRTPQIKLGILLNTAPLRPESWSLHNVIGHIAESGGMPGPKSSRIVLQKVLNARAQLCCMQPLSGHLALNFCLTLQ